MVFTSKDTVVPYFTIDDNLNDYSMCAIDAKYVYFTGGSTEELREIVASCHRYDIVSDIWKNLPDMHHARYRHSSCQFQRHLNVFCGEDIINGHNFNLV